ncbi:hypothetical protein Hanom_Chr14g01305101 [Helianthus anomalus]
MSTLYTGCTPTPGCRWSWPFRKMMPRISGTTVNNPPKAYKQQNCLNEPIILNQLTT